MSRVFLLGLDPGFASLGYAVMELTPDESNDKVEALGIIETEKSNKKKNVYESDDNLRRAKEIRSALKSLIERVTLKAKIETGYQGRVIGICAEAMSFPRNSSSAAKVAITWGLIASMDLPVFQMSPQAIKSSVCGRKSASKSDIEEELISMFSGKTGQDIELLLKDLPRSKREHPYDALAAIVACRDTEAVSLIRSSICVGSISP